LPGDGLAEDPAVQYCCWCYFLFCTFMWWFYEVGSWSSSWV